MDKPDKRLFEEDLASVEFRSGATKGMWGVTPPDMVPSDLVWPKRILWISAAPRENAPKRFHIRLDADGYRLVPPTGTFWDPSTGSVLEVAKRPKGKKDSRVEKVFRTDWENGSAFYHPYDRVAAHGHTNWAQEQPHLVWTSEHTIVDFLEEFYTLLNSGDFVGI